MNKIVKRIISLGITSCVALSMLPLASLAADTVPERGTLTYSEIIKPQYDDAYAITDGLAAVKKDGKWGYIDTTGKVVVPFIYDTANPFSEGLAVVGKIAEDTAGEDGVVYKLGFIDRAGKYTPFKMQTYEGAEVEHSVNEMYFDQNTMLIFHNGFISLPTEYIGRYLNTTTGEMMQTDMYPNGTMNEGVCAGYDDNVGIFGYFDSKGKTVLSWDYADQEYYGEEQFVDGESVGRSFKSKISGYAFNQGLAAVRQEDFNINSYDSTFSYGFINRAGEWVIAPEYTNFFFRGTTTIQEFFGETGLATMQSDYDSYGAIDKTGKVVIPFMYEELWPFGEGVAAFKLNGKMGYLDQNNKIVIPAQFEKISSFSNGCAAAYDGSKAFLIDHKGTPIAGSEKLDPSSYFTEDKDGAIIVYSPGKYVTISENGKYGFGKIDYLPPLPEKAEMHDWAFAEVTEAIKEELVPIGLQNLYLNNISRGEFCDTVVQALEAVTDKDIKDMVAEKSGKSLETWVSQYPLSDTSDENAVACFALGIVTGRDGGVFDPYAPITRQEAAAFLTRSAKVLGMDTANVGSAGFKDGESVGVWFKDAVNFVHKINVMGGVDAENFSPLGTYTREQSYVTNYRLFKAITVK